MEVEKLYNYEVIEIYPDNVKKEALVENTSKKWTAIRNNEFHVLKVYLAFKENN